MELVSGRMRRNHHAQSGLHVRATISSGLGPEASTSISHFFDPCRFHRLRRSLWFMLVMSSSRSLSGHKAVGRRRAADGNRNEASKSIEFCIPQRCSEERRCGHVPPLNTNPTPQIKPRLVSLVDLWKCTVIWRYRQNYRDFLGRFPARPTESPLFARIPSVFGR